MICHFLQMIGTNPIVQNFLNNGTGTSDAFFRSTKNRIRLEDIVQALLSRNEFATSQFEDIDHLKVRDLFIYSLFFMFQLLKTLCNK